MARPTSLDIQSSPSSGKTVHNYNKEAINLWTRLGITPGENTGRYNCIDVIYRSPQGGTIYVGDSRAAQNLNLLKSKGIVAVVNCTTDIPNFHSSHLQYYNFDVAWWQHKVGLARTIPPSDDEVDRKLGVFLRPMLQYIEYYICQGKSVVIHCLAGAHRAGSTGTICLMHFGGMSSDKAEATAKSLRPIIEMIGRFPELIRRCDRLNRTRDGRLIL